MNRTVRFLSTLVLASGGAVSTASAQVPAYYNGERVYVELDFDNDGIPDQIDSRDDRYTNYGSIIRYDRYGHPLTTRQVDRDCDGLIDRYDYIDRPYRDYDCSRLGTATVGTVEAYTPAYTSAYVEPAGYVRYAVGGSLPMTYVGGSYYVDYQPYGLPAPPYGYHWNRVGNDAYLVSDNGVIIDLRYDLFH